MTNENSVKGPWKKLILDEIALEGLEGITIEGMWMRIEQALNLPQETPSHFKNLIWEFIKKQDKSLLEFYEIPIDRPIFRTSKRSEFIDLELGFPSLPDDCPFHKFNYKGINEGLIRGSCEHFYERKLIDSKDVQCLSLTELKEKFGEKFVIVASQDYRESVLFPDNTQKVRDLTFVQYCILEAIGRSRFNGEVTAGKHSLNTYIKEYLDVFYIKIKLIHLQLIVKQPYIERFKDRISCGHILHLPRFYRIYKTRPVMIIETLYNLLQTLPKKTLEVDILKKNPAFQGVSFKKISKLPIFEKHFEFSRVRYREIYPEAGVEKWKNIKHGTERNLYVIRFKFPNITLEDIFDTAKTDNSESENVEFLSEKNFYLDMPLKRQVYRFIAKHGATGCSQTQIVRHLAVNKYSLRLLMKNFLKMGFIKEYATDVGRQRVIMYVTYDQEKNMFSNKGPSTQKIKEETAVNDEILKKIMDEFENPDEPPLETLDKIKLDNLNKVIAIVKETQTPYSTFENKTTSEPKTGRHCQRLKLIVDFLNKVYLVDKNTLRKYIMVEEEKLGYKDKICSKSLFRIIKYMGEMKMARFYELTLKLNKFVKMLYYITHIKLESHFKIFQNEIFKQKNDLLSSLEDRETREQASIKTIPKSKSITYKAVRETLARSPKFLTARYIHEFIYYLVYEQDRNSTCLSNWDKIEKSLMETSDNYDFDGLSEDLAIGFYEDNLSWKMFVQPLPIYKDKPNGWTYIMDIYLRLPLSLIVKMYHISKYCHPLLTEYVNDPVKQHYLVHKLPDELRDILTHFRVNRTFISILKIINWTGLVQMGPQKLRDLRECWMYVNKTAKLLDTTTSSTGYRYISTDRSYREILFTFNTISDVQNYWTLLCRTCLSTKLGAKHHIAGWKRFKRHDIEFLPAVDFMEAVENDIGHIPGDKLGASGIDSSLFSHLQRNWSWTEISKSASIKTASKINKLRFTSQTAKMTIEKPIKLKNNAKVLKIKQVKRIPLVRGKTIKMPTRKKNDYDKVDKIALNKMSSLRVSWSKEEDLILKICRAVYIYLSGSISQLHRAINSFVYRDILHWSLNSDDKTSRACQRRIRFLMQHRPSADVMTWVHELKRNPEISKRIGVNVLISLRKLYKNDLEFMNLLKIMFVKIVYYFQQKLQNTNDSTTIDSKLLPETINQFDDKFKEAQTIYRNHDIAQIRDFSMKHLDPENIEEIEISTINAIMHSTLCCTRDKTAYNIQIFEVYKRFKEDILAKAYKKARDDNLVVQLKLRTGASGSKLAPITGSSLVLSGKYKQQLLVDIPYEAIELCFRQFESSLPNFFGMSRSSLALKTVDVGGFYHLLEMLANVNANIDIQLPSKILTVDPNGMSNSEDNTDRIMDHFHSILDNAPKKEYMKYFEGDVSSANPKIKFNKTNENYKLPYNPFEVLLKLPDDYYHFFCALDNLKKIVDLDFNRFTTSNFCPFNCVLKYHNLISTIERILSDHKAIIDDLINHSQTEEIVESIVVLHEKNIMQVFDRLRTTLREKNFSLDLKDFATLTVERKKIDILQLSKEILEYSDPQIENKLEFESSHSKEEKNKAQDAFVVNLPTLKITYGDQMQNEETKCEYVIYKSIAVPKDVVKNSVHREEILKKVISYSHWSQMSNVKQFLDSNSLKRMTLYERNFTERLLEHLENYELGASAENLVEYFKDELLLEKTTTLLRKHFLIMRVGVENFYYVHKKHVTPWVVNSYNIKRLDKESLQDSNVIIKMGSDRKRSADNSSDIDVPAAKKEAIDAGDGKRISRPSEKFQASDIKVEKTKEHLVREKENIIIRPQPWIRINGSLNRRVFDKWIGVILNDCLMSSGQSVVSICQRFNQLHPTNVRCLLEILQDLNCIKLKVLKRPTKVTLFSTYEDDIQEEKDATEFSRMDETFIVALPNAMVNLAVFIGEKKYSMDFI